MRWSGSGGGGSRTTGGTTWATPRASSTGSAPGEADPGRLLRGGLQGLAKRRLLPPPPAAAAPAGLLRAALRHGRDQLDLLSPATRERGRQLGTQEPSRVPVRGEDEPLRDAHQAVARPRPEHRALLRAHPAVRRLAEARPGAVAAAARV